nr:hypothetical protein [Tanacetum cinerariifolium]
MSDSDESGVTYTDVSSPFEELSDIASLRADDHEYLELPEMLEDPYVEVALQAPPSTDYIPAPPLSPIRSLGYRAAMIRLRAEAASTSHSPPLPPPFILS